MRKAASGRARRVGGGLTGRSGRRGVCAGTPRRRGALVALASLVVVVVVAACSPPAVSVPDADGASSRPDAPSLDSDAAPADAPAASDVVAAPDAAPADAPPPPPPLVDGRFSASEWLAIRRLSPLPPPPPSPTNRYADDPRAAALGQRIFADRGFSADGTVACASCHDAARAFTDGRAVAQATGTGTRNTPSVLYAAYIAWALWDGAADSLWAQPLMAMENPREHASSRLAIAHRVAAAYATEYDAIFGALPPLEDVARFPAAGRPGDPSWEAMAPADQTAVNRVVANVGKALEAFERTLVVARPAPFDRYVAGDYEAMSPAARDGLALVLLFSCLECHNTPLFSDNQFHDVRMPDDPAATLAGGDRGRYDAIARVLDSPFNAAGIFSDAPDASRLRDLYPTPLDVGAFRTPSLRGVARTAPYGHAGQLATLEDVIRHDAHRGLPAGDPRAVGYLDFRLRPFAITDEQVAQMVAFLQALTPDGM